MDYKDKLESMLIDILVGIDDWELIETSFPNVYIQKMPESEDFSACYKACILFSLKPSKNSKLYLNAYNLGKLCEAFQVSKDIQDKILALIELLDEWEVE